MGVTVLQESAAFRLGHVGPVFVTVWYSELTNEALDALNRHQQALAAKYGKLTMVSVVINATQAPGPELRERLRTEMNELSSSRLANIIVVQARGMSAIIARSFLAMLSLISKEHMKVVKTLEEAAAEVRKVPGQHSETLANERLVEDLSAFAALPQPK